MTHFLQKIWQRFVNQGSIERDAYFSGATDRVDLERRIREWERGHLGMRG